MNLDLPVNPGIIEAEAGWAGSVADFGDIEAGYIIQEIPGYLDYREVLEDRLRAQLGDIFWMYRAMTEEAFESWRNGEELGPVGFTLSEGFARAWKNFDGFESGLVIVKAPIRPEWVIMRGKPEEDELVVDGNSVSFHTLGVI